MELKLKLRFFAPMVVSTVLVSLVMGPLYFPLTYLLGITGFLLYFIQFGAFNVYRYLLCVRKIRKYLAGLRDQQQQSNNGNGSERYQLKYVHAIVVPNYNESISTLEGTLDILASHPCSSTNYVIVLAMEEREPEHKMKANTLINKYKHKFMRILSTSHPANIPSEHKGKGSNSNHAVRQLRNYFRTADEAAALNIPANQLITQYDEKTATCQPVDLSQVIITICDADTHISRHYFIEVDKAYDSCSDPQYTIFAPPMFFGRNAQQVPAIVRMKDLMWSLAVAQNLVEPDGVGFPCCTYSLSMKLAEEVDYWDTDNGAIGEDFHMFLKCFFKTNSRVRSHPIFVPVNITNIAADSYFGNVRARFLQSKRHFDGVADVAYALAAAWTHRNQIPLKDTFKICKIVLETHLLPPTTSWVLTFGIPLATYLQPMYTENFYLSIWIILLNIASVLCTSVLFAQIFQYERLHSAVVSAADLLFDYDGQQSSSASAPITPRYNPNLMFTTFPGSTTPTPGGDSGCTTPIVNIVSPTTAAAVAFDCAMNNDDTILSPKELALSPSPLPESGSSTSLPAMDSTGHHGPLDNVKMAALILKAQKRSLSNCRDYLCLPLMAWIFITIPSMMASFKLDFWLNVNDLIVSSKPEIYVV